MTVRDAAFLISLSLAAVASATTYAAQSRPSPEWADEFMNRWYVHYNAGDASGVAAMFTPDARFGSDRGTAAIEASLAADFSKTQYSCGGGYDAFRELGDLAVAWGHESCLETNKSNGKSVRTYERWLLVFRRQPDGKWLLAEETYAATDAHYNVL